MKFADRFPSELQGAEDAILSTLVRKVIGSMCTEPWFSKNWCRIPASCSSYKKHWWGTPHKWMDRNTARRLEKQITNYASNRDLKITRKCLALVSLRWWKWAEIQLIQQGYNDFTLTQDLILHLNVNLFHNDLITASVTWIPLHPVVCNEDKTGFHLCMLSLNKLGKWWNRQII